MPALRPYLALDIETTGLDTEKSQILQIGWVIDDGVKPLAELQKGTFFIDNGEITYGEPYALGMNAWIFQEFMKPAKDRKYPTETLETGLYKFFEAVEQAAVMAEFFDKAQNAKRPSRKVQLAGKNIAGFDWRIIVNNLAKLFENLKNNRMLALVDHRSIDCGGIFFSDFGKNPGFDQINKLIGWKDINHDALDDAINVVVAVRYKAGIPI